MFSTFYRAFVAWIAKFWVPAPTVQLPRVQLPAPAPTVQLPVVVKLPTLWCNQKRIKYHDEKLSKNKWLYNKPAKRRDRDHLLVPNALFFLRVDKEWVLLGRVSKVEPTDDEMQVMLTIRPWGDDVRGRTKNDVLDALGFRELSNQERMWGLIPVQAK